MADRADLERRAGEAGVAFDADTTDSDLEQQVVDAEGADTPASE